MSEPFLIVLNSLPKSALAPLIIVWLGTGIRTIIICGISVGLFGFILNLYQTFAQTDMERIKLIETLGGNKRDAFTKVVFPGSIPSFISIAKVNIGLTLVGVIIGEFLAGRRGLGYLIIYSSQTFKLSMVILAVLILCVIAMGLYGVLGVLERKLK
jgi:NitT/TauT family transport system permease protein